MNISSKENTLNLVSLIAAIVKLTPPEKWAMEENEIKNSVNNTIVMIPVLVPDEVADLIKLVSNPDDSHDFEITSKVFRTIVFGGIMEVIKKIGADKMAELVNELNTEVTKTKEINTNGTLH